MSHCSPHTPDMLPTHSALPVVVAVIISSSSGSGSGLCPHHCKCLWRASKITVDCSGALHASLPDRVNTDTQVLNMTNTALTNLESRIFLSKNLTNLQRLYITQSALTHIHSEVRSLSTLQLSKEFCFRPSQDSSTWWNLISVPTGYTRYHPPPSNPCPTSTASV